MGKILTFLTIVGLLLAGAACSTNTCRENISAMPVAMFYSSSMQNSITVDSITVYGAGVPGDSAIVRNGQASQVYLPLRGGERECRFVFHYEQQALSDPRLNDTLTVSYEPKPVFTSVECGAMYFYDITGYGCTNHLIDSVGLINASVTNVEAETFRIYFRTSDEDDDTEPEEGQDEEA